MKIEGYKEKLKKLKTHLNALSTFVRFAKRIGIWNSGCGTYHCWMHTTKFNLHDALLIYDDVALWSKYQVCEGTCKRFWRSSEMKLDITKMASAISSLRGKLHFSEHTNQCWIYYDLKVPHMIGSFNTTKPLMEGFFTENGWHTGPLTQEKQDEWVKPLLEEYGLYAEPISVS